MLHAAVLPTPLVLLVVLLLLRPVMTRPADALSLCQAGSMVEWTALSALVWTLQLGHWQCWSEVERGLGWCSRRSQSLGTLLRCACQLDLLHWLQGV